MSEVVYEPAGDRSGQANSDRPHIAVRLIRALVGILLISLLGIALGIGVYLGAPALYREFIEPVRTNTGRITELETALADERQRARQDIQELDGRLAELEGRYTEQGEMLAELQAELEAQVAELESQAASLEAIPLIEDELATLSEMLAETEALVGELETALRDANAPAARIARQMQLIRAMEILARARLWLIQDNPGLAAGAVESALTVLEELRDSSPPREQELLIPILTRLEIVLDDFANAPLIAGDDLEVAWRLLVAATAPQPDLQDLLDEVRAPADPDQQATETPEAPPETDE